MRTFLWSLLAGAMVAAWAFLTPAHAVQIIGSVPVEKQYTFHLTLQQAQLVSQGLSELPYKQAAPILFQMQNELNEQLKADQKEKPK